MIRNIGIFGVGGVGGYFGGKLCQTNDPQATIAFFARGEHLREIRKNGLTLKTEKEGVLRCRPTLATDSMDSMPELDLCIICVKEFDLTPLLSQLKDRVSEKTVILPLLNGVDVYTRIRSIIDRGKVLPACVYVGTHIESPGVVAQKGGACKILIGSDPRHSDYIPESLLKLFRQADILHDWRDDIQTCIWEKFIFIASFGTVTAASSNTIGEVLENEARRKDVSSIINEIISIADQVGVPLPRNIAEKTIQKAATFPYDTKTSFQRDFEIEGKPDERDLFAGAILKFARTFGLETPKTKELLKNLEEIKPSSNMAKKTTESRHASS